jgi:hypothetical protein
MRAGIRVAQKVRRILGQISVQQNNVGAAPQGRPRASLRYRYDLDVVFCVEADCQRVGKRLFLVDDGHGNHNDG